MYRRFRMAQSRILQALIAFLSGSCATYIFLNMLYFNYFQKEFRVVNFYSQVGVDQSPVDVVETRFKEPYIFIGGYPRSGTTLMRVLLDVHEDVRCGPETRVIPRVLRARNMSLSSPSELMRLKEAGIAGKPLDYATAAFITQLIYLHGSPAKRLCAKDPLSFLFLPFLSSIFPNAKFLLMSRDGRAVTNSVMSRHVTISNVNISDPWNILSHWNQVTFIMLNDCLQVGPDRCLMVKYEQLINSPKEHLEKILKFLDLSWDENVMEHWKKASGPEVKLSVLEKSTDQVQKPIYLSSIDAWRNSSLLPQNFVLSPHRSIKMLRRLEYISP